MEGHDLLMAACPPRRMFRRRSRTATPHGPIPHDFAAGARGRIIRGGSTFSLPDLAARRQGSRRTRGRTPRLESPA